MIELPRLDISNNDLEKIKDEVQEEVKDYLEIFG